MSHAVDLENTSIAKVKQLKHMYEDYIVQLSKRKILDETLATAVLSDLWNYFAKFEQNFTITSSSSTTSIHSRQQRYDAFPFAKVGMCIVSSVVDALKTQLQICVKEMLNESKMTKPNHPFPEQSPWYDWTKVFPAMQEFETQVDAIVFGWEAEVLGPWKKVQETKREAEKEQQRKLQNDNKARMLNSAFDSPGSSMLKLFHYLYGEKRGRWYFRLHILRGVILLTMGLLFRGSCWVKKTDRLSFRLPCPCPISNQCIISNNSKHITIIKYPNASSLTSAPLSAYALLKLRVQEALALSRLEIANSKKRLAQ
ncbi:hypothetical protein BDR26DRAFT_524623 [Obelidium mucronatum]|nr:hypothetical protein BDR26DRAFT_524623 [Obelidium mucronatum]